MRRLFGTASLALIAAIALGGEDASAQWVRGWRGGGIVVRAPYIGAIRVGVGPIMPRVVGVAPVMPRRRAVVSPPAGVGPLLGATPAYAPNATITPRYEPRPAVADVRPLLTPAQLARLDDAALLNATLDALNRLDADVARFNTGDTWLVYFRIPEEAFPPPTADNRVELGFAAIQALLARFDAIAADHAYPMISGLPSFTAARAGLAEVVARFAPTAGESAARTTPSEELPSPPPALAPAESAASGERSILAR